MDCEKFESTALDELYSELDELTSAASRRHVAGCSRCAALLAGLRATRRVAVLPLLDPPPGLEERILLAARDAQKVVPFRGRLAKAVSLAGSWAMRPQTAMAAVFLLMIGSSVLLVRGRRGRESSPAGASMVVSELGSPAAATAAPPEEDKPADLSAAMNAHGVEQRMAAAPAATSTAGVEPAASAATALGGTYAVADKDTEARTGSGPQATQGRQDELALQGPTNAAAPAGVAPAAPPPAAARAAQPPSQAQAEAKAGGATATFADAMAAYRAKNFDTATREFDALANAGDPNAALWAARSVRDSAGCSSAASRFDQVAARSFGTQAGYDATLEGGRCFKAMGSFDAARSRFVRLLTVPSHAARAQAEIDAMAPRAQQQQPAVRAAPAARARPSSVDSQGY